jgi:hypothetical protein
VKTAAANPKKEYFLGFQDPSFKLRELWHRWKVLEDWIELAVRPTDCHPDDLFLLSLVTQSSRDAKNDENDVNDDIIDPVDDLPALKRHCTLVHNLFNDHLSTLAVEPTKWDSSLVVRPSQIPGAGMGLYYQPTPPIDASEILPKGSVVCYYTGRVHTHSSARGLANKSYLMWIRGNTLVDPESLPHVKARYANDPLNEDATNCAYLPTSIVTQASPRPIGIRTTIKSNPTSEDTETEHNPHEDTIRTSFVTIRDIEPAEELFVPYGDVYWSQQPIAGNQFVPGSRNHSEEEKQPRYLGKMSLVDEKLHCDNGDGDNTEGEELDESFPFSSAFQKRLTKPIIWGNDTD